MQNDINISKNVETNAMIQGRCLSRAGSEATVDKGTMARGRGNRGDVGGEPGRVPRMPRGKGGTEQLRLGQGLPRPSSLPRRPPSVDCQKEPGT